VKPNGYNYIWAGLIAAIIIVLLPAYIGLGERAGNQAADIIKFSLVVFIMTPEANSSSITSDPLLYAGGIRYRVRIGTAVSTEKGIITCYHLISDLADDGFIFFFWPYDDRVIKAKTLKINQDLDLAILDQDEEGALNVPRARLASSPPKNGEEVMFFGSPHRQLIWLRFQKLGYIQAAAGTTKDGVLKVINQPYLALYPCGFGDSGGGVFNSRGELIGIIQKKDNYMPVGYALPLTSEFFDKISWQ